MILEIEPPHGNTAGPLAYNEGKARTRQEPPVMDTTSEREEDIRMKGYAVATENVPEGKTLEGEFDRLRQLGRVRRTRKAITLESFHMSVNPSDSDRKLTDAEAVAFIGEMMQRLGYGDSPYRIYRHQDIAREHFHVVSTRIGQDGRKINDSHERYQLHTVLKELAPKYGFSVEETHMDRVDKAIKSKKDRKDRKESAEKKERKEGGKTVVPPFSRKSDTPVMEQIRSAHEAVMQWHFSTFEQYRILMRTRYNIDVEFLDATPDRPSETILYSGLDDGVARVTPGLSHMELGIDADDLASLYGDERMSARKAQKTRLEKAVRESMDAADSYLAFHAELKKRGVAMYVSWTKDGQPFGVTYLDYATKCIWKGSETATDFGWLRQSFRSRGIEMLQGRREKPVKARRDPRAKSAPSAIIGGRSTGGQDVSRHVGRLANAAPGNVDDVDLLGKDKDEDEIMEEIRLGLR